MFWKRKSPAERNHDAAQAPSAAAQTELHQRVARVIAAFRPFIQADGGDIELLGVSADGIVRVRLRGACIGCPSAYMTLQMGLERQLREQIPQVRGVENVG